MLTLKPNTNWLGCEFRGHHIVGGNFIPKLVLQVNNEIIIIVKNIDFGIF